MRIRASKRLGPITVSQPITAVRQPWRRDHMGLRITFIVIVSAVMLLVCGGFLASVL